MLSSVTDAYQPIEAECRITRQCLEVLLRHRFPVDILTKSPLALRDMDLFKKSADTEVGITITTDEEKIRRIFEPGAPAIEDRIKALREIHRHGIRTYVFIGPLLPMNPERLAESILRHADSVLIDRMNYVSKTRDLYRKHGLTEWLVRDRVDDVIRRLKKSLGRKEVRLC
jgi:DNA repair photolyase